MGDGPAGRGWDWLVREARDARFTLVGEEHGVAETAQFSAALFNALRGAGYNRMAVELSPVIAEDVEAAARRNGFKGVADFLTSPSTFTFYNLREEAQFLADVIKDAPRNERVSPPSRAMSLTNSEPATSASRACFQTPTPRVMK
jgi:hypothetical protein